LAVLKDKIAVLGPGLGVEGQVLGLGLGLEGQVLVNNPVNFNSINISYMIVMPLCAIRKSSLLDISKPLRRLHNLEL